MLLATIALWLIAPWTTDSPSPPDPGVYVCAGGDSLTIAKSTSSALQVSLPNGTIDSLRRVDVATGLKYATPSEHIVLWMKDGTGLLERFGRTRAYSCKSLSDSMHTDEFPSTTVWFRSPTGENGYGFTMQHPRALEIDQPHLYHTRFLYAGPNNDPPALTDGFTVTVRLLGTSPDSSLSQFVDDQISDTRRVGGSLLGLVRDTSHRHRNALAWRVQSAMGPSVRHLTVRLDRETLAAVSTSAVGSDTSTYTRRIDSMLSTLQFRKRTKKLSSTLQVSLAMLSDPIGSPDRGCDAVVFVPHRVARTTDPLTAALDTLFAIDRDSVQGARHFLSKTNETLSLDRTLVSDDVAHVYLEGSLSGLRGVCDNPRAKIQIEETARRVTGLDSVALFLNGERTRLQLDERGARPHP